MKKKGRIAHVLASFLFLFALLLNTQQSEAQSKVVNLNYKDASFVEVINAFRQQTGVKFLYNLEKVKDKRCKDLVLKDEPVDKAIGIVLRHFGFTYSMVEGVVVVKELPENEKKQQVQTITGKVIDEKGLPLPGVTVIIKGTQIGVATDVDGQFKLTLTGNEPRTLVFSFIGMQKKEITSADNKPITVVLKADATQLAEVLIETGYNSLPRKDMVGSYTTLKADDIMMPAYSSIDQMLQGRVPGMVVVNTSSRVGRNPKITIRGTSTILGNTDPLWVVDGIIQTDPMPFNTSSALTEDLRNLVGNQISWLNPADIETITVLKDASATAIYGAKASNGVIVVTTKKGNSERTSIRYSANFSFRARPNYNMFNFMNSKERIQFSKEAYDAGARYMSEPLPQIYTYEGLMHMLNKRQITESYFEQRIEELETVNTDWFDILTRNSFSHSHNLSISGGSQKVSYNASLGYSSNSGVEIGNDITQFNARLNVNAELHKKLRLDINMSGSTGENKGYGPEVNPMSYATNTSRSVPAYENGERAFYKFYHQYTLNSKPQEISYNFENEMDNSSSKNKSTRFDVSINLDWDILPWLKYQFVGSIVNNQNTSEAFAGEKTAYIAKNYRGYDFGTESSGSTKFQAAMLPFGGELLTNGSQSVSYNMQHKALFSYTVKEAHRINAMLGVEIRSEQNKSNSNTVWGYVPDRGEKLVAPTPIENLVPIGKGMATDNWGILDAIYNGRWSNTNITNNYTSFFATLAYSFKNRYVFNANLRADASNRFGQDVNKQFDPTYSFGINWRMAEEDFIKNNLSWLDQLNLRASWGIQGNVVSTISPDLIASQGGVLPVYNEYYVKISSLPNPHLKWERTKTWNFGLDMQLFNGITMNLEYYGRFSNAIIQQDIAQEYGMATMQLNGGRITNHGLEFSMNITPFQKKNFAWTIGFNTSKNWNKSKTNDMTARVDQLTQNDFLNGGGERLLKKGYPLSAFWSYSFAGLSPENGYPTFNYMDFEEAVSDIDPTTFLVYSGQQEPYFTGGLNTRIRYKNLSLGADFSMLLGAKKRLPNPYATFSNGKIPDPINNLSKDLNKRWKKSGDEKHTIIPALYTSVDDVYNMETPDGTKVSIYNMWANSDAMVVSASFFRCTQLSLNWNLSREFCAKFGATSFSISANVNNVFVIGSKRFNGFDPELGDSVMPKIFSFGLSVGF